MYEHDDGPGYCSPPSLPPPAPAYRYPVRTSPQWIGPVLEDFLSAHSTLEIEINSSTDNPLMDPTTSRVLHGGNFQATAVTNATEKTRDGLATLARLLFAQQSELLNATMSNGLEPCLAACDGPNRDGGLKGLDIANASYMSELSWLAGRVNHCVVSAEMHNQSVNSLALVSARYTSMAVDVMMKMCANALFTVLQAIDLRLAFTTFISKLTTWLLATSLDQQINDKGSAAYHIVELIVVEFLTWSHLDVPSRSAKAAQKMGHMGGAALHAALYSGDGGQQGDTDAVRRQREEDERRLAKQIEEIYEQSRREYSFEQWQLRRGGAHGEEGEFKPCDMTREMCVFVREELGVMPWSGVRPRKEAELKGYNRAGGGGKEGEGEDWTTTVGGRVTKLYEAIKDGRVAQAIAGFFGEHEEKEGRSNGGGGK